MAKLIYPLVSVAQSFTDTQKAQVRANIGAAETSTLTSETNNRLNATYSAPIHITTAAGVQAFSHDASGVSAGQYGSYTAQAPVFNGTFHVPAFTVDSLGHVTYASSVEVSIPPLPVVSQTQNGIQTSADKIKLDAMNALSYLAEGTITPGGASTTLTLYNKDSVKIDIVANSTSDVALLMTSTPAVNSGFLATRSSTTTFQANSANVTNQWIGSFGSNDLQASGGHGHLVIDRPGNIANFEIMLLVSGGSIVVSTLVVYV